MLLILEHFEDGQKIGFFWKNYPLQNLIPSKPFWMFWKMNKFGKKLVKKQRKRVVAALWKHLLLHLQYLYISIDNSPKMVHFRTLIGPAGWEKKFFWPRNSGKHVFSSLTSIKRVKKKIGRPNIFEVVENSWNDPYIYIYVYIVFTDFSRRDRIKKTLVHY